MSFNLHIYKYQNNVILSEMKWSRKIPLSIYNILDFSIPLRFIRNDKLNNLLDNLIIK